MPLTRTPLLAETVRKLVARGACVNAYNIVNRLHPSDIAAILGDLSEHLTSFNVIDEGDVSSAYSFMKSEKERLVPELGEMKSRITISSEQVEDEEILTGHNTELDPKRLRPKGQTGLDSFPTMAPPSNIADYSEDSSRQDS